MTAVLPAGTYTLAVSAFLNMSLAENLGVGNLGDGFIGLGSFGTRTNAYAVDISGRHVVAPTLQLSYIAERAHVRAADGERLERPARRDGDQHRKRQR